ncbi:MAG: hypothetical protein WDN50_10740 [Bradyrhizobium sp.]
MAGLVPAIHVFSFQDKGKTRKGVDARDKPGHDDFLFCPFYSSASLDTLSAPPNSD